ncbi:histone deacetylase family protein [Roseovarius faecimaris]|uniref:Histone deacetylase family protein n=1 Tax=Roseovarius faecimaris TaxID=2494550 RepID=A0A6I6IPL2_9RHOB|nr:histone deacetylase family protein [Roseovarius faecimaris]QGX97146.1 histone deacetylase family protein [Roseovarius faecimaris]
MTTALLTHPDCLKHVTPDGHPERVARLDAVLSALEGKDLLRIEAPLGDEAHIERVHPRAHIDHVKASEPDAGQVPLDADTWMSPGSYAAALRGVGGAVRAVDMVLGGEVQNAFSACRPPGHHAETAKTMGFCLFGNVAIAAKHALEHHGLSRVAVVDFDVHHGNGTQDLLESDPRALFISSHQYPLWPGTGHPSETGVDNNVLNVPLAPGTDGRQIRAEMEAKILPRLAEFAPELLLVSAGFDAHRADPLAGLNWETEDFAWITEQLCDVAEAHCDGRLVSCLEGGYDLAALAEATARHVDILIARGQAV